LFKYVSFQCNKIALRTYYVIKKKFGYRKETMVYLDNAATSYPKPDLVYCEMERCMREYCANPGRGGHRMSLASGMAVIEAREKISNFFNISEPMQLCFTKNATEALNIAITGLLKRGDHVITTSMEHNSVLRPLKTLERDEGLELTIIKGNALGEIAVDDVKKAFKSNTKLIVCTLSSNVNGIMLPVKDLGKLAAENGIVFLVDASQGSGIVSIDVDDMNIDMLAFPGHKSLLGPQGTGGLYVRKGIYLKPLLTGGTGSSSEILFQPEFMPDNLESGTLNTPGIVGLCSGIKYINSVGLEKIRDYKNMLLKRLIEGIKEIKGAILYSPVEMKKNAGIVAMNFMDTDSNEISYKLDKQYNIATRAGLHCAPLAHKTIGTFETGVVRLSVGCFNTIEDIDYTLEALRAMPKKF
jgi:cysteine desulfurase/selenocysteine lyase